MVIQADLGYSVGYHHRDVSNDLLSTREVAARLGVTQSRVLQFIRERRLAVEHEKPYMVRCSEVERFERLPRPRTGRRKKSSRI